MISSFMALLQATLVVAGPGTAPQIAPVIARAQPGDTVLIRAGVYREPALRLDGAVTLLGEAGTILDGEDSHEVIVMTGDGGVIQGLTIRNTGSSYREDRAGIRADSATNCRIEGNRLENTFFAIYLAKTVGCVVRNNVVEGVPGREASTGNAVHSWGSRYLLVENNQLSGHRDGLYLEFTRQSVIRHNVSRNNVRYGLHFMYSDSSEYSNNVFQNDGSGVAVMFSHNVLIEGNRFEASQGAASHGLLLKDIMDTRLIGNVFLRNSTALLADGANRLQAEGNRFESNGWAIRLLASTGDAAFRGNVFRHNVVDVTVNSRHSTPTFAGNWWDQYRGWDLNRDGIGDVPHRPVRFYAVLSEQLPSVLLLNGTLFVKLLDMAERVVPALTPPGVMDTAPLMIPPSGVP